MTNDDSKGLVHFKSFRQTESPPDKRKMCLLSECPTRTFTIFDLKSCIDTCLKYIHASTYEVLFYWVFLVTLMIKSTCQLICIRHLGRNRENLSSGNLFILIGV